jgi:hypothetical protein
MILARAAVALMRDYVNDYVNRHDLSVFADFLTADYTPDTGDTV